MWRARCFNATSKVHFSVLDDLNHLCFTIYFSNWMRLLFSDYLFKLLLIGDSGVGKSCLLLRFAVSFCCLFSWKCELWKLKHCCVVICTFAGWWWLGSYARFAELIQTVWQMTTNVLAWNCSGFHTKQKSTSCVEHQLFLELL